jgi:hypothetical protein
VNSPIGRQLPDVPEWTFAATADYSRNLGNQWTLDALLSDRFVGKEYDYNAIPALYPVKPAYNIADARISLDRNQWSVSWFVDNVLDRRAVLGVNRAEVLNDPWVTRLVPNQPRTIGLLARYRF